MIGISVIAGFLCLALRLYFPVLTNRTTYKSIDLNVKFILGVEISFVGGRR